MKQEDIDLLFKDLCARLPYGVKVKFAGYSGREDCTLNVQHLSSTYNIEYLRMRPYLRPMSSMTEEEKLMYEGLMIGTDNVSYMLDVIDWLNKNMFDYRGLIEKGLAIEVTEDNNPYKVLLLK